MKKVALFTFLTAAVAFAQQPKFEIADVHPSATAPGFAQNFGGVLREGRYIPVIVVDHVDEKPVE